MEMNEIINQFNGIAQDFHQVKKKQKLHEMLLMVAISLLIVNILLLYLFRLTNSKDGILKPKDKSENVIIKSYENTISDLKSKNQALQSKIDNLTQPKEEPQNATMTISKEEAKKRQEELIKAGYKVPADGIWGPQSNKNWNEYQQKIKDKK
jgi:hypothetical protein